MDDFEDDNVQIEGSNEPDNDEGDVDDFFEEDEDESDEEDGSIEKWIDVKDLKNMSLDELKTYNNNSNNDADRKLDLPITKVVVRRLPPQITVEDYLQELSEVPSYNYIRLVPPNDDLPSRIGKRSSIYINFDTEQEAFWFKEKYNNMKFFDERGNSYIACVDFSFIQDVAQDPADEPQMGTLEESEMYQIFLKAYEEEPWSFTMNRPDHIPTPEAMLDEILNKKIIDPDSTPLLQFLKERSQKKEAARKDREQRRKEKDVARRKQKDEILKRRQKEKDEAAKRRQKEKEDVLKRKPIDENKDREKDNQTARDRRRERDRERQRERDRERRIRKDKEKFEKEQSNKSRDDQSDKSNQGDKESTRQKSEKDGNAKSLSGGSSGNITYSRSGNPTRWSENSGPRKGDKLKDEHKRSEEHLNQTKSSASTEKVAAEKSSSNSNPPSNSKTKDISRSTFGKPFPTKSDTNNPSVEESGNKGKKDGVSEKPDDSCPTSSKDGNSDGGTTKKRIVKRVIKVKKVKDLAGVENAEDAGSGQQTGSSDTKPKKVIRVIKKSIKAEDGDSSKPDGVADAVPRKVDSDNKGFAADANTTDLKGDAEKERKNKRGRPEIQIYRPGSLRGAPKSGSLKEGDKEK